MSLMCCLLCVGIMVVFVVLVGGCLCVVKLMLIKIELQVDVNVNLNENGDLVLIVVRVYELKDLMLF